MTLVRTPNSPHFSVAGIDAELSRNSLQSVAGESGPFASIVLPLEDGQTAVSMDRIEAIASRLRALGAPESVVATVRLATIEGLAPPYAGSVAVLANADSATTMWGSEIVEDDVVVVDALPSLRHALTIIHRNISHMTVHEDNGALVVHEYSADHRAAAYTVGGAPDTQIDEVVRASRRIGAQVCVVVRSTPAADAVASALIRRLPFSCEVRTIDDTADIDALADDIVEVIDGFVDRRDLARLQSFSFLESHGGAVDGADAVVAAIEGGQASTLLVATDAEHDIRVTARQSNAFTGVAEPSLGANVGATSDGPTLPFRDALIAQAWYRGIDVHIIDDPTDEITLTDGVGALLGP